MPENSRYASNTESVVGVVTHNSPSVRSLNMKHKVYFSADVRKEILYRKQYVLLSSLYRNTREFVRTVKSFGNISPVGFCSHSISRSPTCTRLSLTR